ncbi:hypothetical protein [Actinomadura sp. 9N407]|uniref:hypothetical protein n=1 Tax=Actinomadura sp. 9N407 TaxID=3375154 RepID=UPI00379524D9
MSVRRLLSYGLLLLIVLGLASCGAAPEPVKPGAWVHIALLSNGDAQLDLFAAGRKLRSDADVLALSRRIAGEAFPDAKGFRVSTEASHGRGFARANVAGAYRPGYEASLKIDTAGVWKQLSAQGFDQAGLRLYLPSVPAAVRTSPDSSDGLAWKLRKDEPSPTLHVTMEPQVWRWYAAMLLPLLGAAGVALAFFARRRFLSMPAAAVAIGAAIATIATSAGRQGENLGVAGLLDGRALDVATVAPLAALPLGLPAVMLLVTVTLRWFNTPDPSRYPEARPSETGAFW